MLLPRVIDSYQLNFCCFDKTLCPRELIEERDHLGLWVQRNKTPSWQQASDMVAGVHISTKQKKRGLLVSEAYPQ